MCQRPFQNDIPVFFLVYQLSFTAYSWLSRFLIAVSISTLLIVDTLREKDLDIAFPHVWQKHVSSTYNSPRFTHHSLDHGFNGLHSRFYTIYSPIPNPFTKDHQGLTMSPVWSYSFFAAIAGLQTRSWRSHSEPRSTKQAPAAAASE